MDNAAGRPASMPDGSAAPRRLVCARCGAAFDCGLGQDCWCAAEPWRVPVTDGAKSEDCLCPPCLRRAAAEHGTRA